MNSTGLLLLLAGVGIAAYVVMNQPVTVAGQGTIPVTSSGPLAANCPGDPGCPVSVAPGTIYGPAAPTGTSGLGSLFRVRGPGGWAA